MKNKGKISTWNDEQGYGFITPGAGGDRVFVHIKAFGNAGRRLQVGDVVRYTVSTDARGRIRAGKAAIAGAPKMTKTRRSTNTLPPVVAVAFLMAVGGAVISSAVPLLVLPLYLVASAATFVVYALDKSAARRGAWRISESTLHLLALVGGWPGALIAQGRLRHKSRKRSFQAIFWMTVVVNCAAFAWLFTSDGAHAWNNFIGTVLRG